MEKRLNISELEPQGYRSLFALETYLRSTAIEPLQRELIKLRASQINGCAYCLNMHSKDARKLGETEQRIYCLDGWREAPFYSAEERAILALTEEVTLISQGGVKPETYKTAVDLLGEHKTAQVILAVVAINAWNRIAISTQLQPE